MPATKPNVLLLDADGVLVIPPRPFSHAYAEELSIEAAQFEPFFKGEFQQALVGQADLKDLIAAHHDIWRWNGDPAELLERWFKAEDHVDAALLAILQRLRSRGIKTYLATDQEAYRTAYMRTHMFASSLDGIFSSCEVGCTKQDPQFFSSVVDQLQSDHPGLSSREVLFFDDSPAKVANARAAGLHAEVYTGRDQVEYLLKQPHQP